MSTIQVQETTNKAVVRCFHHATNSGDAKLISRTIDEVVEPDALIRTPLPLDVTGAQALKVIFGTLRRAFPDLHVQIEDLIAEDDSRMTQRRIWTLPRKRSPSCAK
jgi:SnoaL-like polyketide cyclase